MALQLRQPRQMLLSYLIPLLRLLVRNSPRRAGCSTPICVCGNRSNNDREGAAAVSRLRSKRGANTTMLLGFVDVGFANELEGCALEKQRRNLALNKTHTHKQTSRTAGHKPK